MAVKTVVGVTSTNLNIVGGTTAKVYDGGLVLSGIVKDSGVLYVSQGGAVTKPKVSKGGSMHVSDGGKAFYAYVSNGGYLFVSNGGEASFTSIFSGGVASVYAGGTMAFTSVEKAGTLYIAGGSLDSTTMAAGAKLYVKNSGTASRTTLNTNGSIFIDGGVASVTNLKGGGIMSVSNNGSANETVIDSNGTLIVSTGGTANSTTVNGNGKMQVRDGGRADNTSIYGGLVSVCKNGTMTSVALYDDAGLCVSGGGKADSVTLSGAAEINVSTGGTATLVTVKGQGRVLVNGGLASVTTLSSGASMSVSGTGRADSVTVSNGAALIVSDGGVVTSATMWGQLEVGNGGRTEYAKVAGSVTLRNGGTMDHTTLSNTLRVVNGCVVNDTTVKSLATLHVSQGGSANNTTLEKISELHVSQGGTATGVVMTGNGKVYVSQGGTAKGITVGEGGSMCVNDGGTANGITVNGGGMVYVSAGGKVTGPITIGEVVSIPTGISAEAGAVVDFDISTVAPGSAARIDNLSQVYGSPDFTLTVSAAQRVGDYTLTNNSGNFFGTITVKSTAGAAIGTIEIDGTCTWGDYTYSLSRTEGALTLAVTSDDTTPPPAPTIKASTTSPTNRNVILTATFSEDTAQKQYSTDLVTWFEYTEPLSVSQNGMYLFRAIDGAGNESNIMTYTVANIDKKPPEAPSVELSTSNPTNKDVTITVTFSKDSVKKQYSTDGNTWRTYTGALKASKNGTWYFRAADAVGNVSGTTLKVTNIDKTAPQAPTVVASIAKATNQNVTLTANFSVDTAKKQYSSDNKTWKTYSGDVTVEKNGTWYFRGIDAAGNISKVTSFKVSNIDKTPPAAPTVTSSNPYPTNKNVKLTAKFSNDSVKKQYSTDRKTWVAYTGAISVGKNAIYYFRGIDAAGNISKHKPFKVSNIDKTPPAAPTVKSSNSTRPTNRNIKLTASFSSDSSKKQYSTDRKTWVAYTGAISVGKNGTYYFRATDAVGNVSEITSFNVTNIDKTAPKAPTVIASTTKTTNQNVSLTATFSSDSLRKQYSTDKKNWKGYTGAVSASKNGTWYFRGLDAAGNVSKVTSIKVSNIDKTPPAAPKVAVDSSKARDVDGKSVKVTASFSTDSVKKQYSVDGGEWKDYTKALNVKSNRVLEFRGIDKAGNISKVETLAVCCFMDRNNNNWGNATEVSEHILTGVNTSFDKVDYYDLEGIEDLRIVMERGKIKASFYDSNKQLIECTPANYQSASSFEIAASDNPDKNARYFASIAEGVKYLKIEAVTTGTGGYHLYSTLA